MRKTIHPPFGIRIFTTVVVLLLARTCASEECKVNGKSNQCTELDGTFSMNSNITETDFQFNDNSTFDVQINITSMTNLPENCSIQFGQVVVRQPPAPHTSVSLYMSSTSHITLTPATANWSTFSGHFSYQAIVPKKIETNITSSEGTIEVLNRNYTAQLRYTWILRATRGPWQLNITHLDLGYRQHHLQRNSTRYNHTMVDFLLIGPGDGPKNYKELSYKRALFYGSSDRQSTVTVHHGTCYVYLYTTYSVGNPTGFSLHYRHGSLSPVPEPTPTPTTTPVPNTAMALDWLPINGISLSSVDINLITGIRGVFQDIAQTCVKSSGSQQTVENDDIRIKKVSQCVRHGCQRACSAFLVGVATTLSTSTPPLWAFPNKTSLNSCFSNPKYKKKYENLQQGVEFCSVTQTPWLQVMLMSGGMFVVVLAASVFAWVTVSRIFQKTQANKLEKIQKKETMEKRRTSSMLPSHPFRQLSSAATHYSSEGTLPEFSYDRSGTSSFEYSMSFNDDNYEPFEGEDVLADFSKAAVSKVYSNAAYVDDEIDTAVHDKNQ